MNFALRTTDRISTQIVLPSLFLFCPYHGRNNAGGAFIILDWEGSWGKKWCCRRPPCAGRKAYQEEETSRQIWTGYSERPTLQWRRRMGASSLAGLHLPKGRGQGSITWIHVFGCQSKGGISAAWRRKDSEEFRLTRKFSWSNCCRVSFGMDCGRKISVDYHPCLGRTR